MAGPPLRPKLLRLPSKGGARRQATADVEAADVKVALLDAAKDSDDVFSFGPYLDRRLEQAAHGHGLLQNRAVLQRLLMAAPTGLIRGAEGALIDRSRLRFRAQFVQRTVVSEFYQTTDKRRTKTDRADLE